MNFELELKKLGIELNQKQLKQFQIFYEHLIAVNQVMNLTAITELNEVYRKHFLDSLELYRVLPATEAFSLCDIGSGAGFPAIPLAIVNSKASFTMIDSLNKRVFFLNDCIERLGLDNASAYHSRAEEYAVDKRGCFDVVTARAVARLQILCELALPLVSVGGKFIAMKGASGKEELSLAQNAISKLGGKVADVIEFELPEEKEKRLIIVIEKIKDTPKEYPRNYSKIKDKPL